MPLPLKSGAAGTVLSLDISKSPGQAAAVSAWTVEWGNLKSHYTHWWMQVEITTRCKIHHKSKFHYFATSFPLCVQECVPGRCWTHFAAEESDHLSLVSPGPFGDLEGFMLYAQTSSKKTLVEGKWEIILWWVLLMKFQQCSCLHVPKKETPFIYTHCLWVAVTEITDHWVLWERKGHYQGRCWKN